MPQLSKTQLLERVCEAIQSSGWRYLIEKDSHPFKITAFSDEERRKLIIYIWNTTHGGGAARPANEYRIQLTGVTPPLQREEGYQTILLGWAEDWYVFTAYDVNRHMRFSLRSPSIQINKSAIDKAIENGYGFHVRENGKIVFAFRPEFLVPYVKMQERIARIPKRRVRFYERIIAKESKKGEQAKANEFPAKKLAVRDKIHQILRNSIWDNLFSTRVVRAYAQSCAMCGMQSRLIEAAHIVPLKIARNFSTRNGIALCPNHHSAFDVGLIGVSTNYQIMVNQDQLMIGDEVLLNPLFRNIRLPDTSIERPFRDFLRIGSKIRGWSK